MARGSAPRASRGGAGGSAGGWLAGRLEGAGETGVGAQASFGDQEVVDTPPSLGGVLLLLAWLCRAKTTPMGSKGLFPFNLLGR